MKTVYEFAKTKMGKTVSALQSEYGAIRAGRANPQVLDRVTVDYYGTPTPVGQLASISVSEARVLTIQPWDKSVLKGIEKAIQTSDIGINPTNDGTVIRLIFPELNEENSVNVKDLYPEPEYEEDYEDYLEEGEEEAEEEDGI